ncbi:hypothetical protein ACIBG8_47000 [Nonomuraea sp. NPDC050556]|uniref:hypothetical protein n=1 Tax=Nonomuraea sp. NPDC050556 TaxID=3364369 RepID=UPI0037B8F67F
MNDTHVQEFVNLERQKLAIQFAAVEVRIDDKIQAQTQKIIEAISGAVSMGITDLKSEMIDIRNELKADIHRLEEKIDAHTH